MRLFVSENHRIFDNARFVLKDIAGARAGQTIVVIADSESYANARALCDVARQEQMKCLIVDIDMYGGEEAYANLPIMEPLRQAILTSDIAFMVTDQMKTDFGHFLGSIDDTDASLLGHNKRFTFEATGMDRWNLDRERVLRDRRRTELLYAWLRRAKQVRVTTARGTDITCAVGDVPDGMYPVMAIIPFYAEVAIVPAMGSVNGTVVADGASEYAYGQRGFPIRPAIPGYQELYKEPLRLVFRDSLLTDFSGDAVQVARLEKLLADVSPKPDLCDEVGLVTTTCIENNLYGWRVDGSHQTGCVHVALGNNRRRGEIIHSDEHVDFDIHDPILAVDGEVIYENGAFDDALIEVRGAPRA